MSFKRFEDFVKIRRIGAVDTGVIPKLQRFSCFLEKIGEFLNLKERQPVGKLIVLMHEFDKESSCYRHLRMFCADRHGPGIGSSVRFKKKDFHRG